MRSLFAVLFAVTLLAPQTTAAQSVTAVAPAVADTIAAAVAPTVKKKKGGLFGKVKGLAKNKIVKSVAKVALCTAVPGGSMIAGALDAAETKNVAGAAAGVATGAGGGGSCMPGMAGMAGGAGPGAGVGAAGLGALAGASAPTLPGQPSTAMPGMAMSPEQMKQMQEQYGKMGMDTAQLRAMMAGMSGPSPAGAAVAPEAASGAPGLSREKGKILVRNLPWLPASDALQPGSEPVFGMVMRELASAIQATGKHYKIEARVEEQGGKGQNKQLAQKRGAAVLAALSARGVPADRITVSDGKADKNPRIIVSEGK